MILPSTSVATTPLDHSATAMGSVKQCYFQCFGVGMRSMLANHVAAVMVSLMGNSRRYSKVWRPQMRMLF